MNDREERIRARAHQIWEDAGRPEGEDLRHWEQAAREIDEEDAKAKADNAGAGTTGPGTGIAGTDLGSSSPTD